jgi:hypothetical protein
MRRYFKKLSRSIRDDNSVFTELLLAWIGTMLTLLVIFSVLDAALRGLGK